MNTKKIVMPQRSISSMRSKLYSAVAMLLVASTLLVTSSYAWFVMSTAPEVTGIQTQVGANGALEIALLDKESWNDLSRLDMGDIDENADGQTTQANLIWGNLVDLNSATYGLSQITLLPSRLFIEQETAGDGENQETTYKVNTTTLLKTPHYGEDGRVKKLDTTALAKIYNGSNAFDKEGYGVRAIGTIADMSTYQLDLNNARTRISTDTSAARAAASKALIDNGGNMANIVVKKALNGANSFPVSDVQNIKKLANEMQAVLDYIEDGLRQAYAGYLATAAAAESVSDADYQAALEEVNKPETTLASLKITYPAAISDNAQLSKYVEKLSGMQEKVTKALQDCDTYITAGEDVTWARIRDIITPLINVDYVTVNGNTIQQIQDRLDGGKESKYDIALSLLDDGKLPITMGTGSGLLSDIADFVGDYTATVTVEKVQVSESMTMDVPVKMSTKTDFNPVHLANSSNEMAKQATRGGVAGTAITDFYGYAIDLAFRTNADESHLMLQTEAKNRIYDDSENESLMGGGSYMTFKTDAGLSASKMVKLMSGVRVVFMDQSQKVLTIATLDTTLTKADYTELTDADRAKLNADAKYKYYLTGLNTAEAERNIQKSDLITQEQFKNLPSGDDGTKAVVFDAAAGTVTAKLYLHKFAMTQANDVETAEDGTVKTLETMHYTGGITINDKFGKAEISALEADVPQVVTALVYLDGSVVNNSMVAASALQSMTGTLNLQFSSDVTLMPAQNTELRDGNKNNSQDGNQSGNQDEGTGTTG